MKKFFLALSLVALLMSSALANPISVGNMNVYNFNDIKLHAYSTGDNMDDHCYVVETSEGLVLIESTAYKENVQALSGYIKSLNKPLVAALLSYHPNGYKSYGGDVKIYATENALKSWAEGGSVYNLTQSFIQALGDKVAEDLPESAEIINEGDTLKLAGVEFKILHSSDGEDYDIEIPAINAVYRHMMGSKTHNILPAVPYIEAEIADLKNYQDKAYAMILTSHHAPEGQKAVAEKIEYLEKVLELAKTSANKDEFVKAVKEAFPDYAVDAYLEMSAGALFN